MFEKARLHLKDYFDFLDTLDCYINKEEWMKQEIVDFKNNPERQIAALVCQDIEEKLTYKAPFIRILYVLSGALTLQLDNKNLLCSAGCLIMANEWTQVDYVQTEANSEVVSFLFKKEYFSENLLHQMVEDSLMYRFFVENVKSDIKKSNFFVFQFQPSQDIHFYALLLLKQVVKMRYKYNRITRAAFIMLVTEIGDLPEEHLQLKDSTLSSSILMYEIMADIENRYLDISLKYLADKYFFHPNYLSSLIKEETGRTFSEILIACRLRHACTFLVQTNLTVQEIIEKIGYNDKTYFFKLFKMEYGMTPNQYRKQHRKQQS